NLPSISTHSCQDAPVVPGAYPVVIFSHGFTGSFTDYTYLFEDLASRGYIVASVNHTYEATATAFPDGRFITAVFHSHLRPGQKAADPRWVRFAQAARLDDLKFAADELDRLNRDPKSPFAGHLGLDTMAVAGHSLGGLTALDASRRDSRFRAAISIDGV